MLHEFEWMFFVQQTQKFSPTLLAIFLSITWDRTPFIKEFLLLYNVFIIPSGFSAHTPINQDSIDTIHVHSVDLGKFSPPNHQAFHCHCVWEIWTFSDNNSTWISLISRNLPFSLPKVRVVVFFRVNKTASMRRPTGFPRNKHERGAVNLASPRYDFFDNETGAENPAASTQKQQHTQGNKKKQKKKNETYHNNNNNNKNKNNHSQRKNAKTKPREKKKHTQLNLKKIFPECRSRLFIQGVSGERRLSTTP